MKKINPKSIIKCIIEILAVAALAFLFDFIIVNLTNDDSIWLGQAIEVVGAVIFGPFVGGAAALINCTDRKSTRLNGSFDFAYLAVLEITSVVLIGIVYRKLSKDDNRFGLKEIVIFNFTQILIGVCVEYLGTTPMTITLFGSLTEDWNMATFTEELVSLKSYTFSGCISAGLIGTILIAVCTYMRRKYRETGSVRDALAATAIVFPLVSFSTFLSGIIPIGCSDLCALAKGERNYDRANRLFTLGLIAAIAIGILQTLLFWLIKDAYFTFYTATESIESYARAYYDVYMFVPMIMGPAMFIDNIISSEGDDLLSYSGYLGSFVVNVVMSIILSQKMGMSGLALGTLLSYVVYALVVSIHFFKKSNTFRLRFYFSFRDIFRFALFSLKNNASGLCLAISSAVFTKAILRFWGSEYLVACTVLCAMMEVYEMINGPSEAAEFLLGTYTGEKNSEGMKTLFVEAMAVCLLEGFVIGVFLLLNPAVVLDLYGVEQSPFEAELIQCIRFSAIGLIPAAMGGFMSDYYGNTGKPLWSVLMVVLRTVLFPVLFCVTFCLEGGIVSMGIGLMLSQILAVAVFYIFVLVQKGPKMIPYMIDDPDCDKVFMKSFDYNEEEYGRICAWIRENLESHGLSASEIDEAEQLFLTLCRKTEEKNKKKPAYGECVLRFIDEPEIIIKDNGKLFDPDMKDERIRYDVLLSCNTVTIRPCRAQTAA